MPNNVLESYKEGDVLLSFKKIDSKIITHWGEIQPLLLKNEKAGEYFQLISSSKCFSQIQNDDKITLDVVQIAALPNWYIKAQDSVIPDLEERYHRFSNDYARYLKVDSYKV